MTQEHAIALSIIAQTLWSALIFCLGFVMGRQDSDTTEYHPAFKSERDVLGQPRLRTDYSPGVDRKVTSDVDRFIKLRNQKVAENIGQDPPDHGHHT